jgi:DNA-binding MarR family transcriptional regulator
VHGHVLETHLTPAGATALAAADAVAVAIERRISDAFTPAERETLRTLLARFTASIRDD